MRRPWLPLTLLVACATAAPPPAAAPANGPPPTAQAPRANVAKRPTRAAPSLAVSVAAARPASRATLRLATFNIQVFGRAKASKPAVMAQLAAIIRKYDLIAIQEVKDVTGEAPARLLDLVNAAGHDFALALSPRTGREPDDRPAQEQYAFYYRTSRVRPVDAPVLFDDSAHDHFAREPYLSRFEVSPTGERFVLINIHTKPTEALREIAAIEEVFRWAKARFHTEDTFLAVGDFNAGCGYASEEELDALPLHGDAYDWVVPHSADTNLAEAQCPYDRIVVAGPEGHGLVGAWGVDRAFEDRIISDHWPVWVELEFHSAD